jgi:hypothetical protein
VRVKIKFYREGRYYVCSTWVRRKWWHLSDYLVAYGDDEYRACDKLFQKVRDHLAEYRTETRDVPL